MTQDIQVAIEPEVTAYQQLFNKPLTRKSAKRSLSEGGLEFLEYHEGFHGDIDSGVAVAGYSDPTMKAKGLPPEFGFGTLTPPGTPVGTEFTIEEARAAQRLKVSAAEDLIHELVPERKLTANQFDVLVNMAYQYNNKLRGTDLIRMVNEGDDGGVANNLLTWRGVRDVNGRLIVRRGLQRRSTERRARWLTPDAPEMLTVIKRQGALEDQKRKIETKAHVAALNAGR